ncbi:CvfB family protein [Mangrovitalea sediminis]|uniref:CvfB family protein n=1 Tax=Mangrovitalea sediminis TaxID=1982043 RepID=UPI000BE62368|nr:S1-like domain-containing RNA-binding protein [Mangrovitalea sediminis]
MVVIGRFNRLKVIRQQEEGARLDGGPLGQLLLPRRYMPETLQNGDFLDVFLYLDSEDRPIATTERPLAQVGECAWLKVVSVTPVGAFLDWGLPKDLMVPFAEQRRPMQEGRHYLVYLFEDNTGRIAASSKLNRFIADTAPSGSYKPGQAVSLTIGERTDLGVKAIIEHQTWGLLYHDDIFRPVRQGQRLTGYIKRLRPDGKVELSLQQPGYAKVDSLTDKILRELQANGGYLPLSDKSPPEAIKARFHVSKNTFKQAIGGLYKQQRIRIEKDGIHLV